MADKLKKKSAKNGSQATLITRIVVFGILGVLLILALLDFRKKQGAQTSATKIREHLAAKERTSEDMLKSELTALLTGSPAVSSISPSSVAALGLAAAAERLDWKGPFRTYTIFVGYGAGENPPVEVIEGPGEPADE
ncbi:MAG: hypothetical protein KF774_17200 [Planctomyces sp.]|nr:hypothetical protein [Planctomyces sp.]